MSNTRSTPVACIYIYIYVYQPPDLLITRRNSTPLSLSVSYFGVSVQRLAWLLIRKRILGGSEYRLFVKRKICRSFTGKVCKFFNRSHGSRCSWPTPYTWCVQVLTSPKEAFAAAMQSWRECCEKCVCLQGDYIEKWLHFQLPVVSSFFLNK